MFKWFTERAHRVIVLAVEEANRLNHDAVGTEHILLGIIREGEGAAIKVLESLNISPERVRADIEIAIDRGERTPQEEVAFTPQAKKVLELALDEARRLGHNYIGAEHLLLGLIREGEGVAGRVLQTMGAGLEQLERVRSQVVLLRERERTPSAKTAEDLDRLVYDRALLDVRTRLIQKLLELARTRGEVGSQGVFITPRLTQSDLANMVGATTESINKWLQHYIKKGLLRHHRGRLTLLDLKRLREDLY